MSSEKIDIDKDLIRDLADILNETDLSEIEVERAGFRIKVARTLNVHMSASAPPAPVAGATRSSATRRWSRATCTTTWCRRNWPNTPTAWC